MFKKSLLYYKSLLFFLLSIGIELLLLPILYIKEYVLKKLSNYLNKSTFNYSQLRKRDKVTDISLLNVCVHEWGGYEMKRSKTIRGRQFDCGLEYQLMRLRNYKGNVKLKNTITISDYNLFKYKTELSDFNVVPVENLAMDFSGYSKFIDLLPLDNQYVLLMNSSISAPQVDFIDDYLNYFKENQELGMLGISFSSKSYQTLIRNNFQPHIQSFFILTTKQVLTEVIDLNGGFLPGSRSNYKLSIIKFGELKLSKLVLKLGYRIAVIKEDGIPFVFYKNKWYDNGYGRWTNPEGDCRLYVKELNAINPLSSSI